MVGSVVTVPHAGGLITSMAERASESEREREREREAHFESEHHAVKTFTQSARVGRQDNLSDTEYRALAFAGKPNT